MSQKEFALSQIAPYFKDPKLCGFDDKTKLCRFSFRNKMCVIGKNLLPDILKNNNQVGLSIRQLLEKYKLDQQKVFNQESCDILTLSQWTHLQFIHDSIALYGPNSNYVYENILNMGLFTFNDLVNYCKKI